MRTLLFLAAFSSTLALAQERPDEADLFGGDDTPTLDAGVTEVVDAGTSRDLQQLEGVAITSKFDLGEILADTLKIGGNLLINGQAYFQQSKPFIQGSFSAPMLLDLYLDGRPNDRIRAYVQGRLQFDPTRPTGSSTSSTASAGSSSVGLTSQTGANPQVLLDQLWLRFDIARAVYVTVGRQKVRWGVSRIWYPTDFLNSRPRDALNPFDLRLGVNMLKLHIPVESLGWNFYGYGLLEGVNVSSSGMQLQHLGGAVRGEFVVGPAEFSVSGVWQQGKRQRYAADLSTALGPIDVYAEVAFRDGRDFVYFDRPADLSQENLVENAVLGNITAKRRSGVVVQASGGVSYSFNYTDKNSMILAAEYFYNPAGYDKPIDYLLQAFAPQFSPETLDPIQQVALYQGKHNLGLIVSLPGLPGADWITVNLTNIFIINDPAAMSRLDVVFRVLNYLTVQAFGAVFYGEAGGQLRFWLSNKLVTDLAALSEATTPGTGLQTRQGLAPLRNAPLVQAGILLRVSI